MADSTPPPLGPWDLAVSPDGATLFVSLRDAGAVAWVDRATENVTRQVDIGPDVRAVCVSPDGKTLFAAKAGAKSEIVRLDTNDGTILQRIPGRHTVCGLAISPDGKTLYACNGFDNSVSLIDLATAREVRRVEVPREPVAITLTPDGKTLVVANHLPVGPADRFFIALSVTVIDIEPKTRQTRRTDIQLPDGTMGACDVCISPCGRFAFISHLLGNYHLVPSQVENGWINSNVVTVIDLKTRELVNTIGIDDSYRGAGNLWGVAVCEETNQLCVAHGGSHELSAITLPKLFSRLSVPPDGKSPILGSPDDYDPRNVRYVTGGTAGVLHDYSLLLGMRMRKDLPGQGPRGVVVVNGKAYAACYFSDNLSVMELTTIDPVRHTGGAVHAIALGPEPKPDLVRRGEMLFFDATLCYQHWQSCASCHPDGRSDCLNWDLQNDGVGNGKNSKSMLLAHRTPPSMAMGVRASAEVAVRSGIKHILFNDDFEDAAVAIDAYLRSLEPVPSPRLVDGKLSPSARRGKLLFESEQVGCARCHGGPLYTDGLLHNVAPKYRRDRLMIDTPTLIESWRTAPYMHDGRFATMRELIESGEHGGTDELSAEEVGDLVEYVLSL